MENTFVFEIQSIVGKLRLLANDVALIGLFMEEDKLGPIQKKLLEAKTFKSPVITLAIDELNLYFNKKLRKFTVPIQFNGTKFQNSVWRQVNSIQYNETVSYGLIAKNINNPKSVRAVGAAVGSNPISIIIPCHRVLGKNSELTGYAGGMKNKILLLEHEGHSFKQH